MTPVILKPQWTEAEWISKAAQDPGSVQAVTPYLDLRLADRVYCKNHKTKEYLTQLGFSRVVKYKPRNYGKPKPFL